ncbi:UNVERIFIED_CONTAM: hypothetical protein ABID98_001853 [Brevibacillus sp. OAP136]
MPRWNRGRIVGLKYQNMKKQYEDLVLDFNDGEEAVNTLISLINGGGKGVLLQALFQLMKPGTAWGETENRLYQQFFFNEKQKFQAYPFHIVMEWELDGIDKRYLITGGAFTAERQATKSEEENDYDIKPKFLMYVKEVELHDTGLFEFMPLYEGGQAVTIDVLEKWLKGTGFLTFEKIGKYHELLKSYGIDKKDWDTLKEINKNEGGVGAYFEGAKDDYSLFRTKIVPIISKRLQQLDSGQDDLVDIFKSQASIAKNLPILLSRESAFKEFLAEVVPLQQETEKGRLLEQQQTEHEKSGQRLLAAIQHVIAGFEDRLGTLELQIKEANRVQKHLDYEKDNLEYAKLARNVSELGALVNELQNQLSTHTARKEELETDYQLIVLSIAYRHWEQAYQELLQVHQNIESLENSEEARDIKEKMELVADEANKEWLDLEGYLQDEVNRFAAFEQRLDQELIVHEEEQEIVRNTVSRLDAEKKLLLGEAANYENKRQDIVIRYGEKAAYQIDMVLQSFSEQKRETNDLIDGDSLLLAEIEEAILSNKEDLASVRFRYESKNRECEELVEKIQIQEKVEQTIMDRAAGWLQELMIVIDRSVVEHTAAHLERLSEEHKTKLEFANQTLWQKQMAISLREEDFWIANPDIKRLHERLSSQMDVFYGTQFLLALEAEERQEELKKHPLLPFGLVVFGHEWKRSRIDEEFASAELQSPVPIFLREEMNGADLHSFELVSGSAHALSINSAAYQHYKKGVEEAWQAAATLVEELETSIANIDSIHRDLFLLLSKELAIELTAQAEVVEEELDTLQQERQTFEVKEANLQEKKYKIRHELEQLNHEKERIDTSLRELKSFKGEWQQHVFRQERMAKIDTEFLLATNKQRSIGEKVSASRNEIEQWAKEYWKWCEDGKQKLNELSHAVANITFPNPIISGDSGAAPKLRTDVYQKALSCATLYKQLKHNREEQNVELAKLGVDLTHKNEEVQKTEKKLGALNRNWREAEKLTEPIGVLEGRKTQFSLLIRAQDSTIKDVSEKLIANESKLDTKCELKDNWERRISRDHGQAAQVREYADLEQYEREITARRFEVSTLLHNLTEEKETTEGQKTALEKNEASLLTQVHAEEVFGEVELKTVENDAQKATSDWLQNSVGLSKKLSDQRKRVVRKIETTREMIEERPWDAHFKKSLIGSFAQVEMKRSEMIQDTIQGMIRFCEKCMADLERDKVQALQAQSFWANRAAMKVMSLTEAVRHMVSKMSVKNDFGAFPLVKFEDDILPRRPEDVEALLKEHFVNAIDKIVKQFEVIDEHNKKLNDEIKKLVGDEEIMFVALGRRYPTLLVYNMNTENALSYSGPRKEHYATWKTINQGSATTADGSGGQKLAARTVIMMMLLSMKNNTENYWMTLVCDNPLGQAVSAHVLNPVFEVAKKLKFQLIFVSPPELIKTEISQRFPIYYKLDFSEQRGREIVQQNIQYSYRMYEKNKGV